MKNSKFRAPNPKQLQKKEKIIFKFFIYGFVWSLVLGIWNFSQADELDGLIEKEKEAQREWIKSADPLPPAYLWGDDTGVDLTSPIAEPSRKNALCEPLPFDELIELSGGSPTQEDVPLDADITRVRDLLEENCLARPGHEFTAVGAGWQQTVRAENFSAHRERLVCPSLGAYALRLTFNESLPGTPIFFTSDDAVPDGDNGYRLLEPVETSSSVVEIRGKLVKKIPDIDEFEIVWYALNAPNVDRLYALRRTMLTLNDDKLPNETVLWQKDDRIETLWVERVDVKQGSGHVRARAAFDFNADGRLDLLVAGDHAECGYELIFRGEKEGFSKLDLPLKMCRCP